MKKIKNMNTGEVKQACNKILEKKPIQDTFSLQELQLNEYRALINNRAQNDDADGIADTIADIYKHGFVAGVQQKDAYIKAITTEKLENRMHNELVELVYNLPFGLTATYFYPFMCFFLENHGYLEILPRKVRNKATAFIKDYNEQEEQRKKEEEQQKKQVSEEEKQHRKAVGDMYYNITRALMKCDNLSELSLVHDKVKEIIGEDTAS